MPSAVKALFFDAFGTLVDWRTSVAREAEAILKPRGYVLDCPKFADAWRGKSQGAMEKVRFGSVVVLQTRRSASPKSRKCSSGP